MESSVIPELEPTSEEIKTKMQFKGKIARISLAGALVDIDRPVHAVLHISQILSTQEGETIKRVEDVLQIGQEVEVWVKKIKGDHVELTMIKPLALEWRELKKGMNVKGTVVRMEKFGAFVEIGAERPGLIHISEMAHGYVRQPSDVVKEGEEVEAQILEVNRRKKQIKLSIKALQPEPEPVVVEEKRTAPASSFEPAFSKDKTPRRPKKAPRKQRSEFDGGGDFEFAIDEKPAEEAEPTAMEMAMREAMERAKARKQEKAKKAHSVSQEQEQIISRTLEQKAHSS
jgi:small subunit ribosomal protein S1